MNFDTVERTKNARKKRTDCFRAFFVRSSDSGRQRLDLRGREEVGKFHAAVAARFGLVALLRLVGFFALAADVLPDREGRNGVLALADDIAALLPGVEGVNLLGELQLLGLAVLVYDVDEMASFISRMDSSRMIAALVMSKYLRLFHFSVFVAT